MNIPHVALRACLLAEQDARIARLLAATLPIDLRHREMWAGRSRELQVAYARRAALRREDMSAREGALAVPEEQVGAVTLLRARREPKIPRPVNP